ncbi:MAG: hypothetical protein ABIE74_05080 [Pseudomonadota bacterium]
MKKTYLSIAFVILATLNACGSAPSTENANIADVEEGDGAPILLSSTSQIKNYFSPVFNEVQNKFNDAMSKQNDVGSQIQLINQLCQGGSATLNIDETFKDKYYYGDVMLSGDVDLKKTDGDSANLIGLISADFGNYKILNSYSSEKIIMTGVVKQESQTKILKGFDAMCDSMLSNTYINSNDSVEMTVWEKITGALSLSGSKGAAMVFDITFEGSLSTASQKQTESFTGTLHLKSGGETIFCTISGESFNNSNYNISCAAPKKGE